MNGVVQHGVNLEGDPIRLETAPSSGGPWTLVTTSRLLQFGDYEFYLNVTASAWFRTAYAGSATSGPSVSAPRRVNVVPGLLLFATFSFGNSYVGGFVNTEPVRVSLSVLCGATITGGTRVRVTDTWQRIVLVDQPLTPNSHLTATALLWVLGRHSLLVQSYCPGQVSVHPA
ncbi:MAG: hypothetical protein ACHQE5_02630 [Actinomycetes bacterium]